MQPPESEAPLATDHKVSEVPDPAAADAVTGLQILVALDDADEASETEELPPCPQAPRHFTLASQYTSPAQQPLGCFLVTQVYIH